MLYHMPRNEKKTWSLAELAEESGLSPRTIRYYISRGLLDGPVVAGPGAAYDAGHLARLRKIQEFQSRGAMLSEVGRMLAGDHPKTSLPDPEPWVRYPMQDDVVVWVRADASPWRNKEIRKALSEFAAKIKKEETHANDDK
jgi:DNA-binding transcriptional MerR regulator